MPTNKNKTMKEILQSAVNAVGETKDYYKGTKIKVQDLDTEIKSIPETITPKIQNEYSNSLSLLEIVTTTGKPKPWVGGVKFTSSKPEGERTGDAIGATVNVATVQTVEEDSVAVTNSFDNFGIYKDMKVVDQGGIQMVQIPKVYCKVSLSLDGTNDSFSVSEAPMEGYFLHPAFKIYNGTQDTKKERDYVYIARYKTTKADPQTGSEAVTGGTPKVNYSIANFQAAARRNGGTEGNGNGWCQTNWMTYGLCQLLFTIEHATRNSQGIMKGNYSGSIQKNGLTDGAKSTNVQISDQAMSWRGIENLYSNVYEWLDGVYNTKGSGSTKDYYICYDPTKFTKSSPQNGAAAEYVKLNYNGNLVGGANIKSLGYDTNNLGAFFPTSTGGSYNKDYYCDNGYVYGVPSNPFTYCGGRWYAYDDLGLFTVDFQSSSSASYRFVGSRLAYMPM